MPILFLSHSSRDKAVAEELRERLLAIGYASVFLDNHDFLPGQEWEPLLYERLRASRAVIAILSPHYVASHWCFAELTHARALSRPIVPVVHESCEVPAMLRGYQLQGLDDPQALSRIVAGLDSLGVGPHDAIDWSGKRPPYPGLASFELDDGGVYFGHECEVNRALDAISDIAMFASASALFIVGASGSGKSSFLQAGLLPRLSKAIPRSRVLGVMRPLDRPFTRLQALLQQGQAEGSDPEVIRLLCVDQLEELATADAAERARFIEWWVSGANASPRLLCIATLRSDHLGEVESLVPELMAKAQHFSLGRLSPERLLRAITMPAQVAGAAIDDALALRILDDVRERDMLPLLAFTLQTLWNRRVAGQSLTLEAYLHDAQEADPASASGSPVERTIRRTADAAIAGMTSDDLAPLRRALLSMVRITRDGRITRRRVARSSLPEGSQGPIDRLLSHRLLVVDGPEIEPAHEALYEAWPRLKEWVEESREALIVLGEVESAAEQYHARPGAEYLWPRARLERADALLDAGQLVPNEHARHFREAAWALVHQLEAAEEDRARREVTRLRRFSMVTAGVAIVATLAAVVAVVATRRASTATHEAFARQLPALAMSAADFAPDRALLLAVEGMRRLPSREAELALRQALSMAPKPAVQLCEGSGSHLTASADGRLLAVVCKAGGLKIYDAVSSELLTAIADAADVEVLTFNAGNERVVTWAPQGLRTFDTRTGQLISKMDDVTKPDPNDPSIPGPPFRVGGPRDEPLTPPIISALGRYAARLTYGHLIVHDMLTHSAVNLPLPFEPTSVAFSLDERLIGISNPRPEGGTVLIDLATRRKLPLALPPADELSIGCDARGRLILLAGRATTPSWYKDLALEIPGRARDRRFSLYEAEAGPVLTGSSRSFQVDGVPQYQTRLITTGDGRVLVWNPMEIRSLRPETWTSRAQPEKRYQSVTVSQDLVAVVFGGGCVPETLNATNPAKATATLTCEAAELEVLQKGAVKFYSPLAGAAYAEIGILNGGSKLAIVTDRNAWITELLDEKEIESIAQNGDTQDAVLERGWLASIDTQENILFKAADAEPMRFKGTSFAVNHSGTVVAVGGPGPGIVTLHYLTPEHRSTGETKTLQTTSPWKVQALALSPDGRSLAVSLQGSDRRPRSEFYVVDIASDTKRCASPIDASFDHLVWSPRESLLAMSGPASLALLNPNLENKCDLPHADGVKHGLAGFSDDGRFLVLSGPLQVGGPSLYVFADDPLVASDKQGRPVAVDSRGSFEIDGVERAAFSADTKWIAVAVKSGAIHILDQDTRQVVQTIDGHERAHALRFSQDGRFLEVLTGGAQLRRTRYLVMPRNSLIEEACRRAVRKSMSSEEWRDVTGQRESSPPATCPGPDGVTVARPRTALH